MKNALYIDIDTERDQKILIGKPPEITPPQTPEEAAKMITLDISCVCEALCTLIHMADQNGYATKEDLVKASMKYLNDLLVTPKIAEPQEGKTGENTEKLE
jgi:hypothetical protein